MGERRISCVADAEINREREGRSHPEETMMWPTWNTLLAAWTYVMRVVLVAVVLFGAACTGPAHSSSAPSAHSAEGGHGGPKLSGNGNGGSGM
jgi:hypothetical protein